MQSCNLNQGQSEWIEALKILQSVHTLASSHGCYEHVYSLSTYVLLFTNQVGIACWIQLLRACDSPAPRIRQCQLFPSLFKELRAFWLLFKITARIVLLQMLEKHRLRISKPQCVRFCKVVAAGTAL